MSFLFDVGVVGETRRRGGFNLRAIARQVYVR